MLGYKASALSYIIYKLPPNLKYYKFDIPKRSGGVRETCAPHPKLKTLQRDLANILYALKFKSMQTMFAALFPIGRCRNSKVGRARGVEAFVEGTEPAADATRMARDSYNLAKAHAAKVKVSWHQVAD